LVLKYLLLVINLFDYWQQIFLYTVKVKKSVQKRDIVADLYPSTTTFQEKESDYILCPMILKLFLG